MTTTAKSSRVAARAGGLLGLALVIALLAAVGVAGLQGVRFLPVLTGSMTPYAPTGSLVLALPVAGEDVAVGDVVVFRPPAPFTVSDDRPILHRIAELGSSEGAPYMVTKGDANPMADPWRVSTRDADFGRSLVVIPFLGQLLSGGAFAALAFLLGGAALVAGVRGSRQPATTGRHRRRRGGRRTAHREPLRQTISVALEVPESEWEPADGRRRILGRARAALESGLAQLNLRLIAEPVQVTEPDGRGSMRLTLTAAAVPA
ncbi:signal peptidase I [Blastococcus saxobsidens]|uniref:Signal peptidase I n=1 Tax=Blastococcus saxobsidens TaxID=138336 RepID=A0A6L9W1X1_9ACTN|nr:signal peptidase I [Blastococcus saxobsidens]NEK86106.1 signal peptidase I [Blastococcus saxobsidens]